MIKKAVILILIILIYFPAISQVEFSDKSQNILNNDKVYSSMSIATADINGDYYDDIIVLDEGLFLKTYQNTGNLKGFIKDSIGRTFEKPAWTINTGDFDNDGISEIYTCGAQTFGNIYKKVNDTFTLIDELKNVSYAQNSNIVDINNDGFLDLFVCNENNYNAIYINDKTGKLNWNDFIDFKVDSNYNNYGDYGSDFIDFDDDGDLDLFITKCWPGASEPNDPRRVNTLFVNDGDNNYTNQAKAFGLNSGAQSWTGMFGDMDNDGDLDCFVTNHDTMHYYYENINNDTFLMKTGISFPELYNSSIQASLCDFDNNGFLDILITGEKSFLVWNHGNNNFTVDENPLDRGVIHSYGIGDFNNDGFLDIYASYGTGLNKISNYKDLIWINNKNENHFAKFSLLGTSSNRQGIGAKLKIFGPWGIQTRDARIGESYGITNSTNLNFGLAEWDNIDSLIIKWPSGIVDKYYNIQADKHYLIQEGMAINDFFDIQHVGNLRFCTGDSVQLIAPSGNDYSYKWSTGETTQNIIAKTSGSFNVTITNSFGIKSISKLITTELNPIEIPEIEFAKGYYGNCKGEEVQLICKTDFSSYKWYKDNQIISNNSSNLLNIVSSGNYHLKGTGVCSDFESELVQIEFLDASNPIITYEDTVHIKKPIILTATGNKIRWYDNQTDDTPLHTGFTFLTDTIDSYRVYWAENIDEYQFPSLHTGIIDNIDKKTGSDNTNGGLVFDCLKAFTLKSVKVYSAKKGMRRFQLKDADKNVLASVDTVLSVGKHTVNLNFELTPGLDYRLETDKSINLANLESESPQFYRDNNESINFPYENQLISIKKSYFGRSYYYYFYDWQVAEKSIECESDRIAIPIIYDPETATTNISKQGVSIYPNPVKNTLKIIGERPINKIIIYNTLGEIVFSKEYNKLFLIDLNINKIDNGFYFINIISNDYQAIKKIIKE